MWLPSWLRSLLSLLCIILLIHPVGAEQPSDGDGEASPTFRVFAPFWKIDQGFSTKIVIRNRHKKEPVTVTPVLYAIDGREIRLETYDLAPNSARAFDLEEELIEQGKWANEGAVALEFQGPNLAAVTGYAMVTDERRSLFFNSIFRAGYAGGSSQAFYAAWWLRDEETSGTLVLFNSSEEQLTVLPSVAVGLVEKTGDAVTLAAHEVKQVDLRQWLRDNGLQGATLGLLKLSYTGPKQALFPGLLLFNEKTGFSLTANFTAAQEPRQDPGNNLYFPAVLINQPDPVLGFKSNIEFTPHALLSNTTIEFLAPELEASYELPGLSKVESVSLPIPPLAPLQTRLVDFSSYLDQGLIPEDARQVSLRLSWRGAPSDLSARVFTMDRTGNLSFGMEALAGAFPRYDAISWYTAGNRQSLLTIQNISEEEVQARIRLSYNYGTGSYELPLLTIPPRATRQLNLREVIATAQPDENGNVIPFDTQFGTATVEAADGRMKPRLLAAGAEYDPVLGIGGATTMPCMGVEFVSLLVNPTEGVVGGFEFLTVQADWSDGTISDVTLDASLSSADPAIATVQDGGADHGKVNFMAEGATNGLAFVFVPFSSSEDPTFCTFEFLLAVALISALAILCASLDNCFLPGEGGGNALDVTVSGDSVTLQPTGLNAIGRFIGATLDGGIAIITVHTQPPLPGTSLTLTVVEVPNTGGHNHFGDRPLGGFQRIPGKTSISGTLDSAGQFVTTYTAGEFGGTERICVQGQPACVDIIVKVPSQVLFTPHQDTSSYRLVGHTGGHMENHYGVQSLINALKDVAQDYKNMSGNVPSPAVKNYAIKINDMGLPQGGFLDIGSDSSCSTCPFWNPPHRTHKSGKESDINSCTEINANLWEMIINSKANVTTRQDSDAGCNWHTQVN